MWFFTKYGGGGDWGALFSFSVIDYFIHVVVVRNGRNVFIFSNPARWKTHNRVRLFGAFYS